MNRLVELSPANQRVTTRAMPAPETSESDVYPQGPVIRITSVGVDDHGLSVVILVQALTAL
jgi:hypothetical protein